MKRRLVALLAGLTGSLPAASACSDPSLPALCHDLAPPACPADDDADVCADVGCASVYACDDGTWTFLRTCPDDSPEAGVHPAEAGEDAPSQVDAPFDAPAGAFGGPGCIDLEEPDCPLGTALACSGARDYGAGCCGCADLYLCVDGGWEPWGNCTDDGGVAPIGH
jgi:hypothetical protein